MERTLSILLKAEALIIPPLHRLSKIKQGIYGLEQSWAVADSMKMVDYGATMANPLFASQEKRAYVITGYSVLSKTQTGIFGWAHEIQTYAGTMERCLLS